ncbi:MAG: nucleoside recognition protein [Chthoniobacter sp.]|nr:nucleoside recognition protein [Chthoniobacter sp.]
MLNYVWLAFLLIAVLVGGFTGRLDAVTTGAFQTAKDAVMTIALPLVGLMAMWLGMMRLAERGGLVQIIARALRPVLRRLFPEVPPEHPAMGAMVMNMAANMLGLGNAATPLGLRAMALLQQLNPRKDTASNAMCTFLAINTASIQLLPTTAISILAIAGAKDATGFVPAAVLATTIGLTCGITAAKILERLPMFASQPPDAKSAEDEATPEAAPTSFDEAPPAAMTATKRAILLAHTVLFALLCAVIFAPEAMAWIPKSLHAEWRYADLFPDLPLAAKPVLRAVKTLSLTAVPWLLTFLPLYATLRGVKVYEQFTDGAKEAFATGTRIIPFLVAMLVSIRMLREAGVIQGMTNSLGPWLSRVGFPAELLPLVLLRPLSGSATQGLFVELVNRPGIGADSLIAKMAATIFGSTETTFYVLAVYFGSVAIRRTRHAIIAGLTADAVAVIASVTLCRALFR